MNNNSQYLLSLVNSAIHGRKAENPKVQPIDWNEIHDEARAHNLLAVIYPTVESIVGEFRPKKELMELWKMETISLGATQLNKNLTLSRLLTEAEMRNIQMVPVKGIVLAQLYPDYLLRVSGDADVLIFQKDKEQAQEMMVNKGYVLDEDESIDCEQTYHLGDVLTIELHTRLWEEGEGKRLDLLESMNLVSEDSLINIDACDMKIWTLGYTEHLVYLLYHMVKHFFVSGIGIRHLTDVTLFINYYYDEIDFKKFWDCMQKLGYASFCETLFYICTEYFEMNKEVLKDCKNLSRDAMEAMLRDVVAAGVFGGKTTERWKAGRIMRMYYENEEKAVPSSKIRLLFEFLLPKSEELKNQRIDKVKYSKFLPIAWVQRGIFLFKKWKNDKTRCSISSRVDCASERIRLLKDLKLMK